MRRDIVPALFSARRQPFLYISAALTLGILIDGAIGPPRFSIIVLVLAGVAASIALVLFRATLATTFSLMIGFAAAGALLSSTERSRTIEPKLASLYESNVISAGEPVELCGTLAASPEPAPQACFIDVDSEALRVRGELIFAAGRVRLVISLQDELSRNEFARLGLEYGSRVRLLVRLERARGYANPGSPDFNDFLERRGYDLKGVIKSPLLIERAGEAPRNEALAFLYHVRLSLMTAIDSRFNARVAGTLKAMLAGNRYFLDSETAERLRESSTFHTLVIAGLHIGIIAWALLGGRSAIRRRNPARVLICLLALWAYAIMVGLAPPVTRAATMITVGLIGPLLFRRSASINTVALAAFVMLALKPDLVADPGFQLSFTAVAGIVVLALPLAEKLRQIGQWRPTSNTPHPPTCGRTVRCVAEALFWDESGFVQEMKRSPIRFRLKKVSAARLLSRLRIQSVMRAALLLAITSGAIQLFTLPLMAFYFNRAAPVGVLLNVVAGLLTGLLMLAGLGAIAIGIFNEATASLVERVVNAAHYLLANSIAPFEGVPFATFRVAHYEDWHTIVYWLYFVPLVVLAVLIDRWKPVDYAHNFDRTPVELAAASRNSNKLRDSGVRGSAWILCAVAMTAALVAVIRPPVNYRPGNLTVHFLDVGQGDSALVVFPGGKTLLIDGGGAIQFYKNSDGEPPDASQPADNEPDFQENDFAVGEAVVSRFIWSLGRTRVDYVMATHAHADHIGGLSDVVRCLEVGEAVVGRVPGGESEYDQFAKAAEKYRVPLHSITAGEHFEIDGVAIDVLWPPPARELPVTSGNDDSVVLRLQYGSVSILLAGDVERSAEESLVASGVDLRADVMKVPHHGSRTSSTEAFIDRVNPKYAVISVGERSRFGHPHSEVVNRYLARGVKLFQTGRDGTVTVETDGASLSIETYRKAQGVIGRGPGDGELLQEY